MKKGQSDSKIMILRPSAPFSEDLHPRQMQTSKSPKLLGLCLGSSGVEFLVLRSELGAELFNTAGFNDTGLSTGVGRPGCLARLPLYIKPSADGAVLRRACAHVPNREVAYYPQNFIKFKPF